MGNNIYLLIIVQIICIFKKHFCYILYNNIQIIKYNLVEQFDKIDIKENLIISKEENLMTSVKKLKIDKFALKKGQFKTSMNFAVNRNSDKKLLFQ